MRNRLLRWLNSVPFRDPIEQQQAALVQITLVSLLIVTIPAMLLNFFATGPQDSKVLGAIDILLVGFFALIALLVLRSGRFETAVLIATTGFVLAIATALIGAGVR